MAPSETREWHFPQTGRPAHCPRMTDLTRFFAYIQAFEMAYMTDDWSLIAPHFAAGAVHHVEGASPLAAHDVGREAVVDGLAAIVRTLDRRFDARIAEIIDGPAIRDGGIWMRFRLTLCRAGLPDLTIEGDHHAWYDGGDAIARLDEHVSRETCAAVAEYLVRHADALRPEGSGPVMPSDPAHLSRIDASIKAALVRCYGCAKSRQDIEAALAICDETFSIDTVSFGVESADRADTAAQLAMFFAAFPDYGVTLDGLTTGPEHATCWGTARMTLDGPFLAFAPTGRTAELPFFCVFEYRNGLLSRERFFFDRATLCEQTGMPIDQVDAALRQLRPAA